MEKLVNEIVKILKGAVLSLESFVSEFNSTYKTELKEIEATKRKYQNEVLASKAELDGLEAQKQKVKDDIKKAEKKHIEALNEEKVNFNRIMEQENKRYKSLDEEFQAKIKDHSEKDRLSLEMENEAKDKLEKANKLLAKAEKDKSEALALKNEYEEKLAEVQKKDAHWDKTQKSLDSLVSTNAKRDSELNLLEQRLIKTSTEQSDKEQYLKEREKRLDNRDKEQDKRQKEQDKRAELQNKTEENLKVMEEENTKLRSTLEAGNRNVKKIEAELKEKISKK